MKKLSFLLCLLLLLFQQAMAQQIRVSGRVTSAGTGNPAEGISVVVKGKKAGTITGANGNFTILADKNADLVFSGIGFTTKEAKVTGDLLDITLQPTAGDLGEVVVVGYGSQKKASLTGSLVTLNNAALNRRQVSSTSQALQGLAPGVTVQQQSGRPGADGASIIIRGQGSIQGNNAPLIIVDGLALASLDLIDPNAIESITLLKDAASTSIYGNRASNGVVLVKTKRASGQQMKLSYNGFVTKQEATAIPERVSAIDHMLLSNEAERNRTGNPNAFVFPQTLIDRYRTTPANNLDVIDTDWLKEVLTNTGLMQNHNVQLNAGGERMSLFGSFSYLSQQGLIPNSAFNKYDLRLNPEFKVSKKLTLIGVLAYTNSITTNPSTGSAEFIIRQAIGLPAIGGGKYGPGMYGTAAQSNNRNPIAMAEATGNSVVNNNILLTRFGFNFHPIAGLEIEGYWGRQTSNPYTKSWVTNANIYQPNLASSSYSLIGTWPGTTSLSEAWNNNIYTTYLGQATYTKRLGNHTFKFLAGGQSELFTNNFFGASRQGFINPNQPYLSLGSGIRDNNAGANELALAGFFARFNYSYKDKYFLELNGRRDGSSRFSQALDKQWGNFGSISAAWVFSKEKFMESLDKDIVFGKLRASLGGNGNQNIGNSFYVFDAFYQQAGYTNPASSPNLNTNSYFGNVTNLGLALLQFSNPQLGWETSKQWNIGLDLTLAKNFTFTADYYVKTQKDLLLQRTLPASAGGLTNPFVNAGNMENRGWEFTVNYKNRFGKLGVDITAMVSDVKNQVTSLVPGTPFIGDGIRTAPGQAAGSYFGYVTAGYFSDSTEIKAAPVQFGIPWNVSPLVGPKPGDVRYTDLNKDGKVDGDDRTFIGNAFPRYEYSININLNYGNWDLNIFGQGVGQRNNFLSGTGAVPFNSADFAASLLSIHKNYWRPDNENALFPRLLPSGSGGNNYLLATQWIRSAAYFRIKNINLGYTLPQSVLSKTKISNFRIYFSCANLLTLSNAWKGFDPEINSANAEFYPLMRTFTGGINVTF